MVSTLFEGLRDTATVARVFGEPIVRDGVTIIPVARIMGGAGEGGAARRPGASGGRFGVRAAPAGVYVIRDGAVAWEPAIDMTAVIIGGEIVGLVCLLVVRSVVRALAGRHGGK